MWGTEIFHRRVSGVKQRKALRESQSKNLNILFFQFPQSPPGDHPLTTEPEDSGYEIDLTQTAIRGKEPSFLPDAERAAAFPSINFSFLAKK